jgi:DNA excision repair protein ERCC-1
MEPSVSQPLQREKPSSRAPQQPQSQLQPQPQPQPNAQSQPELVFTAPPNVNPNAILASMRQKPNPLLKHVRSVPVEFVNIVPDFLCGASTGVIYLSIKFHLLHTDYIHKRIAQLKNAYRLRILLCQVDSEDNEAPLCEIAKICVINNITLILAFSLVEAARYLEAYKLFENKPVDVITERIEDTDYDGRLADALKTIRSVNKTDVITLQTSFSSFAGMAQASLVDLTMCPGVGEKKAKRIYDIFRQPFSEAKAREKKRKGTIQAAFAAASSAPSAASSGISTSAQPSTVADTVSLSVATEAGSLASKVVGEDALDLDTEDLNTGDVDEDVEAEGEYTIYESQAVSRE